MEQQDGNGSIHLTCDFFRENRVEHFALLNLLLTAHLVFDSAAQRIGGVLL